MVWDSELDIENCIFESNEADEGAGFGYKYNEYHSIDSCSVRNTKFVGNTSPGQTGGYGVIYLIYIDDYNPSNAPVFRIRNTDFLNNTAGTPNHISYSVIRSENAEIDIYNCLFAGNTSQSGVISIYGDYSGGLPPAIVRLENCTLTDNIASANQSYLLMADGNSWYELVNINIANNTTQHPVRVELDPPYHTIDNSNIYASGTDWQLFGIFYQEYLPETGTHNNLNIEPGFVDNAGPVLDNNYNLLWNSELMDMGHLNSPVNFDLTTADIGWQTIYNPQVLLSLVTTIDKGWYEIGIDQSVLISRNHVNIPAGTVIRMAEDSELEIWGETGLQIPRVTIGDEEGQRTSIVGISDPDLPENNADLIQIACEPPGPGSVGNSTIVLEGVMFNYPASTGLWFNNAHVEIEDPLVQLREYNNSNLAFKQCSGNLTDFDFSDPEMNGLAKVSCTNSNVDVIGCTFRPPSTIGYEGWSLKIYGSKSKSDIVVRENRFQVEPAPLNPVTPLVIYNAPVSLSLNQFGDRDLDQSIVVTAIDQHNSTNHMCQTTDPDAGACNIIYGDTPYPLILLDGGELDLYCGYNDFRQEQAQQPLWAKFVQEAGTPGEEYTDWTDNYWGNNASCIAPMSSTTIFTHELVPDWVDEEMNILASCNETYISCGSRDGGGQELYEAGRAAELADDYSVAVDNYCQLLEEYPTSRNANESLLRVKAVALDTEYGLTSCEAIQAALLTLADSTVAVDPELATLERSAAWCIHACHIEPGFAETQLELLLAEAETSTSIKCLDLALLEILTYPPPVGMANSPSAEDRVAQTIYYNQRTIDLLNYGRPLLQEEQRGGNRPHLPQKVALLGCYPNPFNPSTTISYHLEVAGEIKVQVFNLRGQLVTTLTDELLEAGVHRAVIQPENLATGLYFISIVSPDARLVQKVLFVK